MIRLVVTLLIVLGTFAPMSLAADNFLNSVVFENTEGQYTMVTSLPSCLKEIAASPPTKPPPMITTFCPN